LHRTLPPLTTKGLTSPSLGNLGPRYTYSAFFFFVAGQKKKSPPPFSLRHRCKEKGLACQAALTAQFYFNYPTLCTLFSPPPPPFGGRQTFPLIGDFRVHGVVPFPFQSTNIDVESFSRFAGADVGTFLMVEPFPLALIFPHGLHSPQHSKTTLFFPQLSSPSPAR